MPAGPRQSSPDSLFVEPSWNGWIETTGDALLMLEAAHRGLICSVNQHAVISENKKINSGSIFVYNTDDTNNECWTDGMQWTAPCILGNFQLFRQLKNGAEDDVDGVNV